MEKKVVVTHKHVMIICIAILAILSLYNIGNASQIFVLHDEFGYWYNAACMSKYDWSGIAGISPYYSYGYSFLLIPFFYIFNSSIAMYRAAIVINAMLLIGAYMLSCKCAYLLFKDIKKSVLTFLCFLVSCYGGFLFSVNVTWGEPLLVLMFWLLLLTMIYYANTNSVRYLCLCVIEGAYMYMIHQRTLGVLVALLLIILLIFLKERKRLKLFIILLVTVLGCMIIIALIKRNLIGDIWDVYLKAQNEGANNYSGQLGKVAAVFSSGEYFFDFVKGFFSKFFYLFAASGMIILWGGCYALRNIFFKKINKNPLYIIYIFCLCSTAFMEAVSALFVNQSPRLDTILYGRYAEFTVGPLLLFGLSFLYQKQGALKTLIWGIIVYLVTSLTAIKSLHEGSGNMYLSSVVGNLFYDSTKDIMITAYLIVIPLLISIFLFLMFHSQKKYLKIMAATPLLIMWFCAVQHTLETDVNPSQEQAVGYTRFAESLSELGENTPLFFVYYQNQDDRAIERVQSILYDREIQLIRSEDIESLSGDYVLIQQGLQTADLDKYTIYNQTHGMVAIVPNTSSIAQIGIDKQYEESIFDSTSRGNGTENEYGKRYSLNSNHKEGFLTYGDYLYLNAGTYELNLRFRATEITEDTLGFFDIAKDAGGEVILREELDMTSLDNTGYANMRYRFTCDNSKEVEYRVYTYGTSFMELESITYRRVD